MKILKHTKNFSNIYKSSSVAHNCFKSSASNKFITHFNITNNSSLLFTQFSKRNYGAGLGIISWNDDYDTDKPIDPNFPQDQYFDKLRTFKDAQKETNEESDEEVTSEEEDDAGESELTLPNHDTPLEVQQYMKDIAVAFPYREIISVSKHCKVTPAGRVFSFSSFILVGNNNGSAGYGYGRGASAKEATEKAFYDSHKHILTINRDKQNCLIATRVVKFKTCKVTIYPQRRGNNGLVGSSIVQKIYNAFGIEGGSNIRFLKKPRTKNKKTMVKALFKLLEDIKNPQEISAQVGRQYFDPDTIFRRKYFKHIY